MKINKDFNRTDGRKLLQKEAAIKCKGSSASSICLSFAAAHKLSNIVIYFKTMLWNNNFNFFPNSLQWRLLKWSSLECILKEKPKRFVDGLWVKRKSEESKDGTSISDRHLEQLSQISRKAKINK